MKRTKIILIAALGICMLSFMPSVFGKANSRPIEDFTATNENIAAFANSDYVVLLHIPVEVIADCNPSGSVLERDLKDGRILYKVNLHVDGAALLVFVNELNWHLIWQPIFIGTMDYYFASTMIVEGELGDPVPNLWDVWFFGGGEDVRAQITGSGTGVFTDFVDDYELNFTPGDSGKVEIVQVGITKPEGHPFYPSLWPVESIFFH